MRGCLRSAQILDVSVFDIQALFFGQFRILVWVAIDAPEEKKISQADGPCKSEAPAPTRMDKNDPDDGNADGRGKFGCGIVEGGREAALPLWEPEADGFRIRRKGRRLADAK